jgi:hypothetical protein
MPPRQVGGWPLSALIQGIQTVAGGSPANHLIELPVSFDMTSVLILGQVAEGSRVLGVYLLVESPFDDPAAFIELGTSLNHSLLFGLGDALLTKVGQYDKDDIIIFPATDVLALRMHPGASTQGSGLLLYEVLG